MPLYTDNLTSIFNRVPVWAMNPVSYVSANAHAFARMFEDRFQKLPPNAGVIFVSVKAIPAPGGNVTEFEIRLGISKNLTEDIGWSLIQYVMKDEIAAKVITIRGSVYLGFSGACRDKSSEDVDSTAAAPNVSV